MTLCPDTAPCDAPASFITLANLQQLTLHFLTGSNPEMFFRSLVLPQIEELYMGMTDSGTIPGCPSLHFANMAQRSGMSRIQSLSLCKVVEPRALCRIQSLSLCKVVEPCRLVDLLKYTPSLSCLKARGDVVFDNQTLKDMSTGQLGPKLTTLSPPGIEHSLQRILEMVWTRFHNANRDRKSKVSVTPIMKVTISYFHNVEVERWFDKLVDLGIDCCYR